MKETKKSEREEYIEELAKQLKEWDKDLEKIEQQVDKEYQARITDLYEIRSEITNKLAQLREAGEEAFKSIKTDLDKLWANSKDSLKSLKAELEKENS